jgi:hypothetical protein
MTFRKWLPNFITSSMSCMSKVLFKHLQKVQIKSYLRMKLNIEFQKDGLKNSISMILRIKYNKTSLNLSFK